MGARGRAPMPVEMKLLHGEVKKNRLNRNAPKAKGGPVKPDGMSEAAGALWDQLVRDYASTGVLTSVDGATLRVYCEAVIRYSVAAEMLEKAGPLIRGRDGQPARNPLAIVVEKETTLIRSYGRELGFTPSARSALTAIKAPEGDAIDTWEATG